MMGMEFRCSQGNPQIFRKSSPLPMIDPQGQTQHKQRDPPAIRRTCALKNGRDPFFGTFEGMIIIYYFNYGLFMGYNFWWI